MALSEHQLQALAEDLGYASFDDWMNERFQREAEQRAKQEADFAELKKKNPSLNLRLIRGAKDSAPADPSQLKIRPFERWRWACHVPGLNVYERAILNILAEAANSQTLQCTLSIVSLAKLAGCSRRMAHKTVNALTEKGLIHHQRYRGMTTLWELSRSKIQQFIAETLTKKAEHQAAQEAEKEADVKAREEIAMCTTVTSDVHHSHNDVHHSHNDVHHSHINQGSREEPGVLTRGIGESEGEGETETHPKARGKLEVSGEDCSQSPQDQNQDQAEPGGSAWQRRVRQLMAEGMDFVKATEQAETELSYGKDTVQDQGRD